MGQLVMIVDDDHDYRCALEEVLGEQGYEVVGASDGQEALDFLRLGVAPDLILLDLWMPRMDGWQLRQALLEDDMLGRIPVVVMTAMDRPPPAALNVREVIPKPTPLFDIVAVVDRYC